VVPAYNVMIEWKAKNVINNVVKEYDGMCGIGIHPNFELFLKIPYLQKQFNPKA